MQKLWFMILAGLCAAGCEYTADTGDLPYTERLVILGYVRPNSAFTHVHVGRTLMFQEPRSESAGVVSDASVRIARDDTTYLLSFQGPGGYSDTIHAVVGESCELQVLWNGKTARATTRIPYPPVIDTVLVTLDTVSGVVWIFVEGIVIPRDQEVYESWAGLFSLAGTNYNLESGPDGPRMREHTLADGRLHFAYTFRVLEGMADSVWFGCTSYDTPYYDYYVSRGNPYFEGVPLYSYFSGPVRWNVKGDGVGLFVGTTSKSRHVPAR